MKQSFHVRFRGQIPPVEEIQMPRRKPRIRKNEGPLRAVSYRRVSSRGQRDGHGLGAQEARIKEAIKAKGWQHAADFCDVSSGKRRNGRHGLDEALQMLARGDGDVLLVSKLDRLSRSLRDFGELTHLAVEEGWAITILDPELDLTSPNGRLCAGMFALLSEWEGALISQRTREGLEVARASGKRLGRAAEIPPEVERRILKLYRKIESLAGVSRALNEEGVATARGGQWRASTIAVVLERVGAA